MTGIATAETAAVRAHAVGAIAQTALLAAHGRADPIAGFADAPYRRAGDAVIWIGINPRVQHPRMVAVDRLPAPGSSVQIEGFADLPVRSPAPIGLDAAGWARLVTRAGALRAAIATSGDPLGAPRGFGAALCGAALPFPLDLASRRLGALAAAVGGADWDAIQSAAERLLGVGAGLTPSGDDLVSAMLFGAALEPVSSPHLAATGAALILRAAERTHAISAALFADTARGTSYSPLHDLAAALASDAPQAETAALAAARSLTAMGHSSGWDLFAGFLLGVTRRLR